MENLKTRKVSIGNKVFESTGTFRLDVNRNRKKFNITNINAFVPYGKTIEDKVLFMTESGPTNTLLIDKIFVLFKPDESEIHRHNVQVFIQHPDVRIAEMSAEEHQDLVAKNLKKPNPKFTIKNLDKASDAAYDEEVSLLNARYALHNDGKEKLSYKRLLWLAAALDLSYRTAIQDPERKKNALKKQIDALIQSDKKKRALFVELLDKIKYTEFRYYVAEFQRLQIITNIGGIYKVEDRPIASNVEDVISWYEKNLEIFEIHKGKVDLENRK